jgi:simple sugar transport system ATP-binding protein
MERRTAGAAILLISEDLDEILTLSDRVAVLYEGRVVGIMDAVDTDVNRIGLLMTGGEIGDTAAEPVAGPGAR